MSTDSPADSSAGPAAPAASAAATADLFAPDGRLKAIPRKPARRAALLDHLAATLFETDRAYTEREVNEALKTVHDDFPALRRYLITGGQLSRTNDGSAYRRQQRTTDDPAGTTPTVA
ncbi:DUF2087 domain-containing protein [Streptomyces sp. NPDC048718]|uniref:DUF2087 domain-containing protein n=1 Tax=Streptomyces sp. NPDC048718 TaxID=3365587 RepID=UPI003716EAAC